MKRILVCLLLAFQMISLNAAADLAFHEIEMDRFLPPGEYNPAFTVYNNGTETISEFTIAWSVNGATEESHQFTGLNISPSSSFQFFEVPSSILINELDSYDIDFRISMINGLTQTADSDNQKDHNIQRLLQITEKQILFEKMAATWCGNCPTGQVILEEIVEENPDAYIPVVLYKSTDLVFPAASEMVSNYGGGQPKGLFDRAALPSTATSSVISSTYFSSSFWTQKAADRLGVNAAVQMSASTSFDSGSRDLTVDLSGNFLAALPNGDYRVNCYVVEDDLTGYPQTNYNSSIGPGTISNYNHKYVVREMLGGLWGTSGVISNNVQSGTQINHQYTYNVPSDYDESKMYIVAVIQEYGATLEEREILNALQCPFNTSRSHSLEDVELIACASAPDAPVVLTPNTNTVCPGDVISLEISSSVPSGFEIQWQRNAVDLSGQNGLNLQVSLAGNYSAYFKNIDPSLCSSDNSPSFFVQQGSLPYYTFNEPSFDDLTVDFNVTLNVMTTAEISWAFGDGDSSTSFNTSHTYDFPGTYVVCIDVVNDCGSGGATCNLIEVGESVKFLGKVFLEGPYNPSTGLMKKDLSELIPTEHPYDTTPFDYSGAEFLNALPNNAVDWVIVEARSGTLGSTTGQTTLVEQRAAILLDNGVIVDVDGVSGVGFNLLSFGEAYYFVVRHRNHLDIISSIPIIAEPNTDYDFTNDVNQAAGNNQLKLLSDGNYAMFAGDFNGDGIIQNTDADLWRLAPAINQTYSNTDGNLDRTVQNTDLDLWKFTGAKLGHIEVRLE